MRLLHFEADKLVLTNFTGKEIPAYAILSHRWTAEEILFDHVSMGKINENSAGWRKIKFCAEKAAADGLKYFWCDTCCIDKWNPAELSRSVNSMFQYYRDAAKCYVYLQYNQTSNTATTQPSSFGEGELRQNEWFKRGWTLQELVAPSSVEFFDPQGQRIGDRTSYRQLIYEITGIPLQALDGNIDDFSIADRMKWADGRVTTEPEDGAYCLLGILGVEMPLTYGEGRDKAMSRLQEELEATTKAVYLIPFSRKDHSIGHGPALAELERRLFGDQRILAILGNSGLGKSHLALEFAYVTKERRSGCSVFWCDASNKDSLRHSYDEIARKLRLSNSQAQPDEVRTVLHQYLNSSDAGEWLLVYDNADEISFLSTAASNESHQAIFDGLPRSAMGSILITTKNLYVAARAASGPMQISEPMQMPQLDLKSSAEILKAYLGEPVGVADQRAAVFQLAKTLRHPLAIVLAAAHIRTRGLTVGEYVKQTEAWKCDIKRKPFKFRIHRPWKDQSVRTVIEFSLDRIMKDNLDAAKCLFEISCMHRTDIPFALINESTNGKTGEILAALAGYGLITKRPALSSVDMPSLVQHTLQGWLERNGERRSCHIKAQRNIYAAFPNVDERNRSQWRRLIPHALHVFKSGVGIHCIEIATLWSHCARALYLDGRYDEAAALLVQVVNSLEEGTGQDGEQTLASMGALVLNFASQGRLEEAEELGTHVVESCKRVLHEDHPITLFCMTNLSMVFFRQRRLEESEELQAGVVERSISTFGQDHPNTIAAMASLATTFSSQERWDEAETLETSCLEMRKRILGGEHPDTLSSMANLAVVFMGQERWKDAEELQRETLKIRKRVIGEHHPETLMSTANLAWTISEQGQLEEAVELQGQVLAITKVVIGEEHPSTLTRMSNLAKLYSRQGRLKDAESLLVPLVEASIRVLGPQHPDTIIRLGELASMYNNQGNTERLEELKAQYSRASRSHAAECAPVQ
ncbi:Vegetative incompatibility protein [Paramyrothecium foliicola]|nr:Vegetative incompatibility protein [Paramyrothecium foliicola]